MGEPVIRYFNGEPNSPVTSMRLHEGVMHDRVWIWNRHGLAGDLVVQRGDGIELVRRLMPNAEETADG